MTAREALSGAAIAVAVVSTLVVLVYLVIYIAETPREGIVRQVWLEPAHSEQYQSGSICMGRDDNGNCTYSVPVYSTRWVPDRCWVRIDDVEKTKRQATWQVDCYRMPSIPVGEWVKV
jgi:hypothetical protein